MTRFAQGVTLDKLRIARKAWEASGEPKMVNNGIQRGGLRLGQHIWNQLGEQGQSWPELFHERNNALAYEMAQTQVNEQELGRGMVNKTTVPPRK